MQTKQEQMKTKPMREPREGKIDVPKCREPITAGTVEQIAAKQNVRTARDVRLGA